MDDVLIVGGGVIGLSLAYELARRGARARVIDRAAPGQEASWAGAGILPPAARHPRNQPSEQLAALSCELHPVWAERLREETGLDNGFRRCGGLYLARGEAEAEALGRAARQWQEQGVRVEPLSRAQVRELEPRLAAERGDCACWHLPDEAQLRNPRHLQALKLACAARGVRIDAGVEAEGFEVKGEKLVAVRTVRGRLQAGQFCLAGGAWSRGLAERLGYSIEVVPVRGQIVLLECAAPVLSRIVNWGPRYLVPRADGRVLAGSTEEHAGFDKSNTSQAVAELAALAIELVPDLAAARFERAWAGLRPGTRDGLPYLGRLPALANAFIAAGHFRSGLALSPATAVVMAQLLRGESPAIDLAPFSVERG